MLASRPLPNRYTVWRRLGASLSALAIAGAAPPRQVAAAVAELGAGLVFRDDRRCRLALVALVLLADGLEVRR